MKINQTLFGTALIIASIPSVYAVPIQIDFTGTISYVQDIVGNGLAGPISNGDTATGRIVFDDSYLTSYYHYFSPTESWLYDSTSDNNWISSQITVNGHSYVTADYRDFYGPNSSSEGDNVQVENGIAGDAAYIFDQSGAYLREQNQTDLASSLIRLAGNGPTSAVTASDFSDLSAFVNLLTVFSWTDSQFTQDGETLDYTYSKYATFTGSISSISATRLDASVPEPSSLVLLAAGVFGLAFTRRFNRK